MKKLYACVLYGGLSLFLIALSVITFLADRTGYCGYAQWEFIYLMMFFFGLILVGCAFFYGKLWAIIGLILFYVSFTGLKLIVGYYEYEASILDFISNVMFYFAVFHIVMLFCGFEWKIKLWWLLSAIVFIIGGLIALCLLFSTFWFSIMFLVGSILASIGYFNAIRREFDYYY